MIGLAGSYLQLNKFTEAEICINKAMHLLKKYYPNDEITLAWANHTLAALKIKLHDHKNAELLLKKVLELYKKLLGEKHILTISVYNSFIRLYIDNGDYEKAEEYAIASLNKYKKIDHPTEFVPLQFLGDLNVLRAMSKPYNFSKCQKHTNLAKTYFTQALSIRNLTFPQGVNHKRLQKKLELVPICPKN